MWHVTRSYVWCKNMPVKGLRNALDIGTWCSGLSLWNLGHIWLHQHDVFEFFRAHVCKHPSHHCRLRHHQTNLKSGWCRTLRVLISRFSCALSPRLPVLCELIKKFTTIGPTTAFTLTITKIFIAMTITFVKYLEIRESFCEFIKARIGFLVVDHEIGEQSLQLICNIRIHRQNPNTC